MTANSVLDSFIKTYSPPEGRIYKYPTFVRHKGTVIAFAMDDQRKIYYSVLNPDAETEGWSETPVELIFPTEIAQVGFGAAGQTVLPVFKQTNPTPEPPGAVLPPFNSTDERAYDYFRSTTGRLTSDAPFQALSDGQYVYVFRQALTGTEAAWFQGMVFIDSDGNLIACQVDSDGNLIKRVDGSITLGYVDSSDTWNDVTYDASANTWKNTAGTKINVSPLAQATLLVDRFMLVGTQSLAGSPDGVIKTTARLQGKLEVRYQRSRMKTTPRDRKDSLGARDLNGNLFYEPTQELDFVGSLDQGRFTVLLLPTQVANLSRWQIFTYNANTRLINSFNIERSGDGLFNTRGSESYDNEEHRYSGSALLLDNSHVSTGSPSSMRTLDASTNSFSYETWVRPKSSAASDARLALFSNSSPHGGPIIFIVGNCVGLGISDGTDWYENKSPTVLTLDEWNHIAMTFDSSNCHLYVNGELVDLPSAWDVFANNSATKTGSKSIGGIKAAGHYPNMFGAGPASGDFNYSGSIEEIRFWNRARRQEELQADMHRRLTGPQPGLVGYWRFDEGSGAIIHNLTDGENDGTISGTPQWQTSTAPIRETAGIEWDVLQFKGRNVTSGLAAILYFRQANSATGYSGEQKPLKQEGRVLLAAATAAPIPLGIGTIGAVSYILNLDAPIPAGVNLSSGDTLAVGRSRVTVTSAPATGARQIDIDPPNLNLLGQTLPVHLIGNSPPKKLGNGTTAAQSSLTLDNDLSKTLSVGDTLIVGYTTVIVRTAVAQGKQIDITFPGGLPNPLPSGAVTLEDGKPYLAVLDFGLSGTGKLAQVQDVIELANIIKPDQKKASEILQQISELNAQPTLVSLQQEIDKLNRKISELEVKIQNPKLIEQKLENINERNKKILKRDQLQEEYDRLQAQYDTLLNELRNGPEQVPMQMINMDPAGLTVTGGLLNFAWTADTPRLFDSATGNIALYYRGSGGQFFVAYYQSMNGISQVSLLDKSKNPAVVAAARSSDMSINSSTFTVKIDGTDPDKCTVTIIGETNTESLTNVPRFALDFIDTLNERNGPVSQYICAALTDSTMSAKKVANTSNPVSLTGAAQAFLLDTNNDQVVSLAAGPKVTIQGNSAATCTVKITSGVDTETWNEVPRDPTQFVQILSGQAGERRRIGTGTVSQDPTSGCYTLNLPAPLEDVSTTSFYIGNTNMTAATPPETEKNTKNTIYITPPSPYPWPSALLDVYLPFDDGTVSPDASSGTSYYCLTLNTRKLQVPPRPGTVLYVGSTKATVNRTPRPTAEKIYISPPEGTTANPWSGKQTVYTRHGVGSVRQETVLSTSYYVLNLNVPLFSGEVPDSGASFYIGDTQVKVGTPPATNQNPDQKIYITPPSPYPWPSAELDVYLPPLYEYDKNASTTQDSSDMHNGSRLLVALPFSELYPESSAPASAPLVDNQVLGLSAQPCQWTAAMPGTTLDLDGGYASLNASKVKDTAITGDLTLEAWARPSQKSVAAVNATDLRYIIKQGSGDSDYSLGLQRTTAETAVNLNGPTITIPNSPTDSIDNITIEIWIKPITFPASGKVQLISHHGLNQDNNMDQTDIYLGLSKNSYLLGQSIGGPSDSDLSADIPAEDKTGNKWVHLAGTKQGKNWILYVNGELKENNEIISTSTMSNKWVFGGFPQGNSFKGAMDEVRIWKRARTQEDIQEDMYRRLKGNETDLVGYWHFEDDTFKDCMLNGSNNGTLSGTGTATAVASPLHAHFLFAGAQGHYWAAKNHKFASGSWEHLAAVLRMPAALHLDGPHNYLDAGKGETLNIIDDLTIEAFLQVDDLNRNYGILTRGDFAGGAAPYALAILEGGQLLFSFQDVNGKVCAFTPENSSGNVTGTLSAGMPHKIAVTRKIKQTVPTAQNSNVISYSEINFFVDGGKVGVTLDNSQDNPSQISRSNAAVEIGRAYAAGLVSGAHAGPIESLGLRGILSQVRIWKKALDADKISQSLTPDDLPSELVAWWKFSEGDGKEVADHAGQNHARIKGAPNWVKDPDPSNWTMSLYRNGEKLFSNTVTDPPNRGDDQFTLGACKDQAAIASNKIRDLFEGELEELRVWNVARTTQQIRDNLFGRLQGDFENLAAYYTFDADLTKPQDNVLKDLSPLGNDLTITTKNATPVYSTAPIGQDTPQVRSALAGFHTPFSGLIQSRPDAQEYGQLQYDSRGNLIGVFKRCYTFIQNGKWQLITGFKVGDLYTEWVGQAQFAPQLYGYIEGAPPVPGENLTERAIEFLGTFGEYNDASTVTLIQADRTTNIISASRDTGFDMSIEGLVGGGFSKEDEAQVPGFSTKVLEVEALAQLHFLFEYSKSWLEEASIAIGKEKRRSIAMKLRGRWQNPDEDFTLLQDRRFLPDNTGMALVQSQTADVFALRLKSNNALISYQMQPNQDISQDWNIITFPIDPHYTKQGTLDGKLGTAADPDYPNAKDYSPDISYFKPIEAYRLKGQIEDEEAKLQTYFEQYAAGAIGRGESAEQSGTLLTQGGSGQILMANLASGLYDRTTNLQYLKDRIEGLAKRNLVNTYVWTADGGFFAESEQTMDAMEEQAGGSYSFRGMGGVKFHWKSVWGAGQMLDVEVDALFGGHIDTTVTKSQSSETAFELEVEIDKVENDLYEHTYDEEGNWFYTLKNGRPQKKPGKVDAYRFMTFFLAPKNDYHDLFFDKVVDQGWLKSDDPGALALRQARDDTRRPAAWRIMHRVTYVSRVLDPLDANADDPLEKTMKALEIDSNYELIKRLEPYVANRLDSYAEFSRAVDEALQRTLPELVSYAGEIKRFLSLYFGVDYDVPKT
jgi:hypothetical protein